MDLRMRGGGRRLPLLFIIGVAAGLGGCSSPPQEGRWALPRPVDPLVVRPAGEDRWWVGDRRGVVWQGPPWVEVLHLAPGRRAWPTREGFFWLDTTMRTLLHVGADLQVDTLLRIPDTSGARIRDVRRDGAWMLVRLTSRLLLRRDTAWWTLPFWGQTADLRRVGDRVAVVYAQSGWVFRAFSSNGVSWTVPETLLSLPYPVMELHLLREGGVLVGWSPRLGPPRSFLYIPPTRQDTPRWLSAAPRGVAYVGTRVVEGAGRVVLVSTLMDTTYRPVAVQAQVFRLSDVQKILDTLLVRDAWVYDAFQEGNWVVVVAAGKGTLHRLRFHR